MTARNQTLAMVGLAGLIGVGITAGWLYTRPVMTAEERADVESRAERLRVPSARYASESRAPSFDCAPPEELVSTADHVSEEHATELAARRDACTASFQAAWEHVLPPESVDTVALSRSALALERGAGDLPHASRLHLELLRVWVSDSWIRGGRSDLGYAPPPGLDRPLAAPDEPVAEADADEARRMLARIRAHHVSHLHRLDVLTLQLLDDSATDEPDEALAGVCRAAVVDMAEALQRIGCDTLTTHACFDRVNELLDAHDRGRSPEWTPLLPPRERRAWDAHCRPLTAPLREIVRRAVLAEMELALLDEWIAHAIAGGSIEAAMARPLPSFEGEPFGRRRSDPGVVFEAPDWIGRRGEVVLSLPERYVPPPAPPPLFGAP